MLYAVIMRHDSLREISVSMLAEARKLSHLGISMMPTRSTLSDANARRSEKWMNRLQIIDSTTISLFSNLLFKGVGRNPKTGKKKGGIKVHTVIHANEGVPSIELLFKQIKQNFPLRYFYGESRNAIKIQIWVTLIANLLLMVMQGRLKRHWSFSGLATMVRLVLMYYIDFYSLMNQPDKDWQVLLEQPAETTVQLSLF